MLKHFQEDLKDYHYQTEVFTYSPIIINEIEKWKLDYENELQEMNNGHFIDNLEKYLEVLKSSL